jgi:hypothetical protein
MTSPHEPAQPASEPLPETYAALRRLTAGDAPPGAGEA